MASTPSKRTRSMEDVWEDISLSCSLPQDMPSTHSLSEGHHHRHLTSLHGGGGGTTSSFSLRGIFLQDFLPGAFKDRSSATATTTTTTTTTTIPPPPSHGHLTSLDGTGDKDGAGTDRCCHDEFGGSADADRRKKRMMKNRESAVRSRARKQAYTNELEKEAIQLQYENKMLRRQNEELKKAMAHQVRLAKKRTLRRTLTALF